MFLRLKVTMSQEKFFDPSIIYRNKVMDLMVNFSIKSYTYKCSDKNEPNGSVVVCD